MQRIEEWHTLDANCAPGIRRVLHIPRRSVLYSEGDISLFAYRVQDGALLLIKTSARGKTMATGVIRKGDLFGEECSLATSRKNTAVATCESLVEELATCSWEDLLIAAYQRHLVLQEVWVHAAESRDGGRERLIYALEQYSGVPLRVEDLAWLSGLSREATSRLLGEIGRRPGEPHFRMERLTGCYVFTTISPCP